MTNRKIASEIAVGVILLITIVVGGIFWLQSKKTETSNQEPVTSKNEVQKPKVDAPVITTPNKQQSIHVAYTRQLSTSEEPHLIYDGKDLGEVMNRYFAISGNHIGFFQKINNESHIIYDGKDLGDGSALELDGDNITFIRTTNGNNPHVIHNGIDFGSVDGEQDVMFDVSGDNVALERIIDGKTHIFYNQKDLGEGESPSVG